MKKSILFLILFCSASIIYAKPKKIVIKMSGSKDGIHFKSVIESHTGDNHYLSCSGAGNIVCGWQFPPQKIMGDNNEYDVTTLSGLTDAKIKEHFSQTNDNLNVTFFIDGIRIKVKAKLDKKDNSIDSEITISKFD